MDKEIESAYVAGIIGLIVTVMLIIVAINSGLNTTSEFLWALGLIFGGLSIGSFKYPKTIGRAFSKWIENVSKNMEEKSSSYKQEQTRPKNSPQIQGQTVKIDNIIYNEKVRRRVNKHT